MVGARRNAPRDQLAVALEEHQPDIAAVADQDVAIDAAQRRAGDDAVTAGLPGRVDPGGDRAQPGPAILVGQRLAVMHLLDIRGRVEPVAVLVDPMQAVRQHRRDRALAGAGDAHDHDDGRAAGAGLIGHAAAPERRRDRGATPDRPPA